MNNKMKISNIVIDSKIDLFNSKIIAVIGSAGSGKTQFLKHLYHFYNGLRFAMLYENKETLECFSNERKHSEFEFSNKKVAIFDGFYSDGDRSFMNMIRKNAVEKNVHKIFVSAHTYKTVNPIELEQQIIGVDGIVTRRRFVESTDIRGGKELIYSADTILRIEKGEDGLYKLFVTKSRNQYYQNSLIPFFATLADEYSRQPLYPNRFLRQHLSKYNKIDHSIYPMDNFKDIFNI